MKKLFSTLLTFSLFCGALSPAFGQTIISGGENGLTFVGDFSSVTIADSTDDEVNAADIDQGWITADDGGIAWDVVSGEASRTGNREFQPNALALAFDSDADGLYTLSFDYDLGVSSNGPSGWALLAYTSAQATTDFGVNLRRPSMDATTWDGLTVLASNRWPAVDSGSTTVQGSVSEDVTLSSATYQGYIFMVSGSLDPSTVDDVTLTVVPEPSAGLLVFAALGSLLLFRRRRG